MARLDPFATRSLARACAFGLACTLGLVATGALAATRPEMQAWVDPATAPTAEPAELLRQVLAELEPIALPAVVVPTEELAAAGGHRVLRFEQYVGGVPVFRARHAVVLRPDGSALAVLAGESPDPGEPGPFLIDATSAGRIASRALGRAADIVTVTEADDGWLVLDAGDGGEPLRARRVILPEGPTAAWRIDGSESADPGSWWCVLVDATAGNVLRLIPLTRHVAANGRVYPRGLLAPPEILPFVDGDAVLDVASPAGWMDADLTVGNNVNVSDDRTGDTTTTAGVQARGTGDPLMFDFPVTGVPLDDLDAALANVFWATNVAHDKLHALGFDERSGNAQIRNFGRGGRENDRVNVFVQYRAGAAATTVRNTSNATANTDGTTGQLLFGLWNLSGELRDAAFDTGIVFHEYIHIAIPRLVGGDNTCDDGIQPAGLAEGWCDFFAHAWTGEPVIGAWVSGNTVSGIRTSALPSNSYNYGNLCNNGNCSATENGEIWVGALWDMRAALVSQLGAESGADMAERLIIEGMRLTPCRPTYPQARDGILLADLVLTGGAHHCLIWNTMAGRGLGLGAATSGPDDRYAVPAFNLPAECATGARVTFERPRYGDDADALALVFDAAATPAQPRTLRVTTSGGDVEDFDVPAFPGSTGRARQTRLPLRPGAPAPGDGTVQVGEGATVASECIDCSRSASASTSISRALLVTVNSHQLASESCHDDDSAAGLTDFAAELPSLLDAGELATVTVTLGNSETFPLDDVVVRVTSDNPNVTVLPAGPMAVGRVRGRFTAPAGFAVNLRALVAPAPSVAFGDTVRLTFDITARGLSGTTSLSMPLAGDYRDERATPSWGGAETFETSSPTSALWTHAPANSQPGDQWGLQACGRTGRGMTYTSAGCAAYADTSSAATLVSPPLFDFSNGVQAVHATGLSWWNDVQLGRIDRNELCDAELVTLFLSDSTARIPYAAPLNARNICTQYWIQTGFTGDERNTVGYVQGAPRTAIVTASTSGMSLPAVRLYWSFFTDVYNAQNNGNCRLSDPQAVGGGYKLDDVLFTYDLARLIPAANMTCTQACGVRTVLAVTPPGGARCAAAPLLLSAVGTEAMGCTGAIEYRFTGPATDTGYTTSPTAVVAAADGATWTVTARCSSNTACSQAVSVADPTLDDVDVGRIAPASLRVHREGDDVVLAWQGTRAPIAYASFRATVPASSDPGAMRVTALTDLAASVPADVLRVGAPDALVSRDAGAARDGSFFHAYRVLSRVPCAGTALVP